MRAQIIYLFFDIRLIKIILLAKVLDILVIGQKITRQIFHHIYYQVSLLSLIFIRVSTFHNIENDYMIHIHMVDERDMVCFLDIYCLKSQDIYLLKKRVSHAIVS
jgi:hypothetical protein